MWPLAVGGPGNCTDVVGCKRGDWGLPPTHCWASTASLFSGLKTRLTFNEEPTLGNLVFLAELSQIKGGGGGEN